MNTEKIIDFLKNHGYQIERDKSFTNPAFSCEAFATKKGHNYWIFLPYRDFIFFHDLDKTGSTDLKSFSSLHERAREWVNAQFKTPRALRYKVPNIVTIGISVKGFDEDAIRYTHKKTLYDNKLGGEKHSVYLIDLKERKIHSQGLETVRVMKGGSWTFRKANPTNRVFYMMKDMFSKI